jgi:CHAT domain-containing protein
MVVLSACETGLGKLSNGDEMVGLTRAFIYAGTPSIITTLWKVNDRSSYELMSEFYGHLKSEKKSQALRLAQLKVMEQFPEPFYWAAYQLTGEP